MRIGFIYPFRGLASVPSLDSGIAALRAVGWRVDVFSRDDCTTAVCDAREVRSSRDSRLSFIEDVVTKPAWARAIPYSWYESAVGPRRRKRRGAATLRQLIGPEHLRQPFTWFVGVDPEGLVEAEEWGKALDVPYVYWSLEFLVAAELRSPRLKRLKCREVRASRGAEFTIVQDNARGAVLAAENAIPAERLVYVPNSAAGQARRQKAYVAHEKLGIGREAFVAICAGTIAPWCMSEDLVLASRAWPDNVVLVLHSRFDMDGDGYVQRVLTAAGERHVRLSEGPLSLQDYRSLIDSADVGIALYRSQDSERYLQSNLTTLGLSSGKVSAYLQAGLPVVVSRMKGPTELVERYACGAVVDEPTDVLSALTRIASDYDRYSAGATLCFAEELEFESHFAVALDRLAARPEGADS